MTFARLIHREVAILFKLNARIDLNILFSNNLLDSDTTLRFHRIWGHRNIFFDVASSSEGSSTDFIQSLSKRWL